MDQPDNSQSNELTVKDLFDGRTIGTQFAIALRHFITKNIGIKFKSGTATISTPGGKATFAHNLGVVPNAFSISSQAWLGAGPVVNNLYVDPSNLPDATNFYLLNSSGSNASITFSWIAFYIPTS